jgi:hypothetical protein
MAGPRRPFLLASAPVESLDRAIPRCLAWGGRYSAGDATDKLNSSVIGQGYCIFRLVFSILVLISWGSRGVSEQNRL